MRRVVTEKHGRGESGLGLQTLGVRNIPCECGKLFIGKTCSSIDTRVNAHYCHILLYQSEKSAVAEHSIDLGHWISLNNTSILTKTSRRSARLLREQIYIELNNNMKREDGFCLSK
jgi:hypothetical protein